MSDNNNNNNNNTIHSLVFRAVRGSNSTCSFAEDCTFGPAVPSHCRAFDFTLYFEQAFLSLVPSLLLISLSTFRLFSIFRRDVKTFPGRLYGSKLVSTVCYACLQLAALTVTAVSSTPRTSLSIPAATFAFVGSIMICLLSYFEHFKSIQPSALLNVYLFFSVIFDAAQLRTLWRIQGLETVASVFSSALALKIAVLVLEAWEKGPLLSPAYRATATPEAKSGIYNRSLFWWLNHLFKIGFNKVLAFDDLYSLDADLSGDVLARKAQSAWATAVQSEGNALLWSTFSCLKWPLLAPALPRLALIGFNYSQPLLINKLTSYVGHDGSGDEENENTGYGLIGATAIIYLGLAVSNGRYQHGVFRSMTMIRGALSSLIYRKTLDLRYSALEDAAASVTLMSTDVDAITACLTNVHELWASAVEVVIAMYLLGRSSGVGCIAPIVLGIAGAAANAFWVGPEMKKRRLVWNNAIQQRVSLTSSILKDMKSMKMVGLTDRVKALLQSQRGHELERSKAVRLMIIWLNQFANLMPAFAKSFVLMTVSLQAKASGKHALTVVEAYTMLSLISLISNPLGLVTAGIPSFMGGIGCFSRIQQYLLSESKTDDRLLGDRGSSPLSSGIELRVLPGKGSSRIGSEAINLNESSFGYSADTPALRDLSTSIRAGSINMVVGPVGSGKTTLLLGLLGELQSIKGFVRMEADVAYCQQSAWLPNETIRNIITGILPFEEPWYRRVVYSCGLEVDISRFPSRDQSLIGSRGLSLSGGQRQRLALARAVYARKAIILLDDIFSALDARTERLVFDRLFSPGGLFRQQETTVILVTHAVHHLHTADHIIALGKNGYLVEQGSFTDLVAGQGYFGLLAVQTRRKQEDGGDYESTSASNNVTKVPDDDSQAEDVVDGGDDDDDDDARRTGDLSIYKYYAKRIGSGSLILFLALQFIKASFFAVPELWVQFWTADNGHRTAIYISVMFVLSGAALLFNFAALWVIFIRIVPRSGLRLHWTLLSVVLAAPIGYFAKTDAGVILNRFSQDMTIIDTQLPVALLQLSFHICNVLWNAALICYGSYYLTALVPLLAAVVYAIQKFYLRTSRQLRLLDLEMRSPLFTHFTETQEGLVTIRAFQWQGSFFDRFLHKLDASQRPYYLLFMIQQWLGFCLALVVAAVATILVAFATQFRQQSSASAIGIALVNVISFGGNLATLISHWTQLETSIGAVSRLKQLEAEVKPENLATESESPPANWPSRGAIEFENVSAGYSKDSPAVLHDINLSIKPGEKIGICGRTGSGKSTLVSLLFRLVPTRTGSVTVDSVDLSRIPRQKTRTSIIAIPQEPYILAGSVRFNAAPISAAFSNDLDLTEPTTGSSQQQQQQQQQQQWDKAPSGPSDAAIKNALEKVTLWSAVAGVRGGLDAPISELGLSHGQKQLFCLGRALLLKHTSSILVLDEATSSVDRHTDETMRRIVRVEFARHTVVSVAHRLSSLAEHCDRVVVMDEGRVVEVGDPAVLAGREGGWWRSLWEAQN